MNNQIKDSKKLSDVCGNERIYDNALEKGFDLSRQLDILKARDDGDCCSSNRIDKEFIITQSYKGHILERKRKRVKADHETCPKVQKMDRDQIETSFIGEKRLICGLQPKRRCNKSFKKPNGDCCIICDSLHPVECLHGIGDKTGFWLRKQGIYDIFFLVEKFGSLGTEKFTDWLKTCPSTNRSRVALIVKCVMDFKTRMDNRVPPAPTGEIFYTSTKQIFTW